MYLHFNLFMTKLACSAKVNLFLAIRDRDSSGYHEIETILVRTPELQDFIHIEKATAPSFECDSLPAEGNTVLKVIKILEQETSRTFSYKIRLEKNIPPMSGLGGGSSDAAAIMLYLNEHEGLDLPHKRLMELAALVGMDVPFFISGHQVAFATHYGEIITPLPNLPENLQIEIHQTGKEVSTKTAYENWDASGKKSTASSKKIIQALENQDPNAIIANLHNDFQSTRPFGDGTILTGSGGAFCVVHAGDN
jgi:4-diphosphocytidyl-2-C-methyl-D-erythritol kinase